MSNLQVLQERMKQDGFLEEGKYLEGQFCKNTADAWFSLVTMRGVVDGSGARLEPNFGDLGLIAYLGEGDTTEQSTPEELATPKPAPSKWKPKPVVRKNA